MAFLDEPEPGFSTAGTVCTSMSAIKILWIDLEGAKMGCARVMMQVIARTHNS